MSPVVLSIVVFVVVVLSITTIGIAAMELNSARRSSISKRLAIADRPPELATRRLLPLQQRPATVTQRIDVWFERLLSESGLAWRTETALLLALACGLVVGGLLFLWRNNLLLAFVGAVFGIAIVIVGVSISRARRHRKMRDQLPDAISLLSQGVQAGESLEQALQLVGDHADQPLADEFQNCARHLDMGLSIEATMRALIRRMPTVEVQILASTLVVQRRTGGDLPSALESLAQVIRDRMNYYRQFRAATAASRISAVLIAFTGPTIAAGLWAFHPEYLTNALDTTESADLVFKLAITAAGLFVVGLAWIFRLLKSGY